MKKKTTIIKPGIYKYLLVLPLLLLSFCQSEFEKPLGASENKQAIDAKVLSLMKSAIQSDSDQVLSKNKGALKGTTAQDGGQCTNFLYPMTFQVYSGDDPTPVTKEINSDQELIAFIEAFTYENNAGVFSPGYEMFIYFPITLLDTDGYETVLNSLTELEGTLQMAVEACASFSNGSGEGSGTGSGGGSGDGSTGSGGGAVVVSNDGSNDSSDDGSDDSSYDGSDDSSDDGSDDSSDDGSDDSSDDESDDSSDDGSDDSSDDESDDSSDDESDDSSDDESDSNNFTSNQSDHDNGYKFCDKNSKKVYICHKGKTICVSVNAIWGHLQHHEEDFLGTCDD